MSNLASSPDLGLLFAALAKAQSEMKPAVLDCTNPHFKSKYASLTSVQDAYREPLSKHQLSILQQVFVDGGEYFIRTTLGHSSGQWLSSTFKLMLDKQNMQGLGSAISYARRYGVSALIGIVDTEDDDGNAASEKPATPPQPQGPVIPPKTAAKVAPQPKIQQPPTVVEVFNVAMNQRGWTKEQLQGYIERRWGFTSSKDLTADHLALLLTAVQTRTYDQAMLAASPPEPGSGG